MTAQDISETVPQTTLRRKPGRPPTYPADLRERFPHLTQRGRQNRANAARALRVLGDAPGCEWLLGADGGRPRFTVLAELGRVEDDGQLREFALRVCQDKPRSKDAAALVRGWRLGGRPVAYPQVLIGAIIGAVNDYLSRHAGTTLPMIRQALAATAEAYERASRSGRG
jgi:hypothetical protein